MAQIHTLKKNGESIYPITHTKGVVDDNGNTVDVLLAEAEQRALRKLFIAAGAEYNDTDEVIKKTAPWETEETWVKNADGTYTYSEVPAIVDHLPKHYYLNGLGDITEEQMIEIYNAGMLRMISTDQYSRYKVRTNIPMIHDSGFGYSAPDLAGVAYGNNNIECFILSLGSNTHGWNIKSLYQGFSNCVALKYLPSPINAESLTNRIFLSAFAICRNLLEVYIYNLKVNLVFKDSSNIYKKCIVDIIQKATPTTAITITLHADAYARIANQPDIIAALEAQPLVTLVSA